MQMRIFRDIAHRIQPKLIGNLTKSNLTNHNYNTHKPIYDTTTRMSTALR